MTLDNDEFRKARAGQVQVDPDPRLGGRSRRRPASIECTAGTSPPVPRGYGLQHVCPKETRKKTKSPELYIGNGSPQATAAAERGGKGI